MNPDPVTVKIVTEAKSLPQNLGFISTILIHIHEEIEELAQDQTGMITRLESYQNPTVSCIKLKPFSFTQRNIPQLLHRHVSETQIRQILSKKIALDCGLLHGRFLLTVHIKFIRPVRFMLAPSVTVPSKAASDVVLQRLVDETERDLEEKEKATSCSICMENLSKSCHENIIEMPKYLQMFHQGCIFEWLKHHKFRTRVPCVGEFRTSEALTETPRLA